MTIVKKDDYYERNADDTQSTVKRLGGFQETLSELPVKKGKRALEMEAQIVSVQGVAYNTDETSLDRMNRLISLANMEFNYRLSLGETPAVAYANVYNNQTASWVGADNLPHTVQYASIAEALKQGMMAMGITWAKYA